MCNYQAASPNMFRTEEAPRRLNSLALRPFSDFTSAGSTTRVAVPEIYFIFPRGISMSFPQIIHFHTSTQKGKEDGKRQKILRALRHLISVADSHIPTKNLQDAAGKRGASRALPPPKSCRPTSIVITMSHHLTGEYKKPPEKMRCLLCRTAIALNVGRFRETQGVFEEPSRGSSLGLGTRVGALFRFIYPNSIRTYPSNVLYVIQCSPHQLTSLPLSSLSSRRRGVIP